MMRKQVLSLKARAIKFLSSREHSRLELARKLAPYAQDGDDIEALLDWLEQAKYLSSERFTESLVHRRAGRFGNQRILHELQTHGIDGDTIAAVRHVLHEDETVRAAQVLSRKFSHPPEDAKARARYMRFLQQRGFSGHAIRFALDRLEDQDEVDA